MDIKKRYDVILLGAGIGGLVSGAILSKNGKKVLIVEKNDRVGGCCVSFNKDGFTFDAGAHILCGCEKYGYMSNLFRELGIKTKFYKVDSFNKYYIDGKLAFYAKDAGEYFQRKLTRIFKDEKEMVDQFFLQVKKIYADLIRNKLDNKIANGTYESLLNKYFGKNKQLKSFLSAYYGLVGERPKHASSYSFVAILLSYLKGGGFYPKGGSQKISNDIKNVIEANGGDFLMNSKAEEILLYKNRVKGIKINKSIVECGALISNLNPGETFTTLLSKYKEYANDKIIKTFRPSTSFFCLYLVCNASPKTCSAIAGWHFTKTDMNRNSFIYIFCPSIYDEYQIRKGHSILEIFVPAAYDETSDWRVNKERKEDEVLAYISKLIKGFKTKIITKESATPRTIERFTGNINGAAYGWAQTPNQVYGKRNYVLPNSVYLAGHWANPGGGVMAVSMSGVIAARKILKNYSS